MTSPVALATPPVLVTPGADLQTANLHPTAKEIDTRRPCSGGALCVTRPVQPEPFCGDQGQVHETQAFNGVLDA